MTQSLDSQDEHQALLDMARSFAAERVAPFASAWEAAGEMPRSTLQEVAELGMAAIYVREEAGGSGLTRLEATLIFEGLASGCPSRARRAQIR